ncbi:hypothetical protein DFH06DRAFT_1297658 [Mycena polygramma]|nr:hypothetical protein DFH06DRAFT_1297658 [Mycena polygramma]
MQACTQNHMGTLPDIHTVPIEHLDERDESAQRSTRYGERKFWRKFAPSTLSLTPVESRLRRVVIHLSFCLLLFPITYRKFCLDLRRGSTTTCTPSASTSRVKIARALPTPISAATDSQHRPFVLHLSFCLWSSSTSYRGFHDQRPSTRLDDSPPSALDLRSTDSDPGGCTVSSVYRTPIKFDSKDLRRGWGTIVRE